MTRAVTWRPGDGIRVETVTVDAPGRGLLEVEIRASGVCHSDLHIVNGDWPSDRPLVLGHEAAGVVTRVGEGVEDARPGDHVVLTWFAPCARCANCAAGRSWLCTGTKALDNTLPDGSTASADVSGDAVWPFLGLGAFSERVIVPESAIVVVPDELPFEIGALLGCSVTTGIGAVVNTASVPMGASAVVIGCGGVGLSIIMGLKLIGANPIIAVDVSEEKLAVARSLGANVVLRGDQLDVANHLQQSLGGVDFAFEAIGSVALIETLPDMLAPGGTAVLVGMPAIDSRARIDPFALADQGKSILGCNYGSSVPRRDVPRFVRLFLAGRLPLGELIGARRPLEEAEAALDDLRRGVGLRTILIPASARE